MKTLIASDFHSVNPVGLVRRLQYDGEIDRFVSLGDYDEPGILRDILNLEIDKIVLCGNHDHSFVFNKGIRSENMIYGFDDYVRLWQNSKMADYVVENTNIARGRKRGL